MTPATRPVRSAPARLYWPGTFLSLGTVLVALVLDACGAPLLSMLPTLSWLHVAAFACVAWALLQPGALRDFERWTTPFDGLLLAAIALATVGALSEHGRGPLTTLLGQAIGCGGIFFALARVLRRKGASSEMVWRAFSVATVLLGAHALWVATTGLPHLVALSQAVDERWAGNHGMARALAFATVATGGRAAERGASPAWRLSFLVGVLGLAVYAAAGAFVLDPGALGRLDQPMNFSIVCVTWLMAAAVARTAWAQRRECRAEAPRWRLLAIALAGLGLACALGDGTGGEGVRALAALAAATTLAARERTDEADVDADDEEDAPLARAA